MNRNLLKWILIAAVILGAAGYLILSETPSGKKSSHTKGKKEQIVTGNSKAFKIEPVEGITISAPKNALDKDREFTIKPVSDKTWKESCKKVEEAAPWQTPILCFDLDAGMKPDEVMPGVFKVAIDLDKLGIPESLRNQMSVWRDGGGDVYEYTSWVENGKLCFNSDQNCPVILVIPGGIGIWYAVETYTKHECVLSLYKHYFFQNDDLVIHEVKDKNGDFTLFFRFGDTEEADRFESYKLHVDLYKTEYEKLKSQADEIYNSRVDKKYKTELGDMNFWQKLVGSTAAYNRAKEAIDHAFILDSLCKQDDDLQRYERNMALPPSIQDIEHYLKISNSYFTEYHHMKPQTKNIEVYLTDGKNTGGGNAMMDHPKLKNPYMVVNYFVLWANNPQRSYTKKGRSEQLLLTLNHELFHHRQHITKYMDYRTMETTAPYNEFAAAWYFYKKGEMQTNLFAKDAKTKAFINDNINTSPRNRFEIFGAPFNQNSTNADVCYVYADFMDFLQRKTTQSDTTFVGCGTLVSLYHNIFSHKKNYMRWFSIDDEKVFDGYLRDFCFSNAKEIWLGQNSQEADPSYKLQNLELTKDKPIVEVKTGKCELVMRSLYVSSGVGNSPIFNAFIVRDKGCSKDDVAFIGTWDEFAKDEKGNYKNTAIGDYFEGNESIYWLGYFKVPKPSLSFSIVGLFKPEAPEIRKVKEDQITFIVPKPARALTKEKLITGVVVTYKDKNGKEITREIEPKNFGKKATWTLTGCSKKGNSFTLSLHWFYKLDEQTTYVSPESEPAQWGAKGDQPEEEEIVLTKEPETNYWKQVSSRMTMKNTSIDVNESNDDEVSSDYRSIDLQAAKTGRSLEFTGMGATEEKTKENGRVYVQDIFIEGTLTYTEPPKFWIPTQQYKAHWEIADDPYLTKVEDPFVFEAKNTSSDQAACAQSKKDKIDNGRSSVGKVNWLRGSTTTFEARHPEKNGPKSFTLTQTYSIKERQGSDLMATVTFVYNYEWVGEEEPEPELETENVPEGGCWKLVKTETNDSHMTFKTKNGTTATISGGAGEYTVHIDYVGNVDVKTDRGWMMTQEKDLIATVDRRMHFDTPKSFYLPGEKGPGYVIEEVQKENKRRGSLPPRESSNYYPSGYIEIKNDVRFEYERINTIIYNTNDWGGRDAAKERREIKGGLIPTPWGDMNGFKIFLLISTQFPECYMTKTYTYEWVEGGKKAEPVKEPAKEKPITGGHWKLIHTGVSTEQGMITGSAKGITIQGSNGHYTAHVERDGMISDREINFEKPKSVYMPGEEITLKVTNEKPKIKGGKEGMSYGDIVFSTGQWDGCVEYEGDWDDKPSYSNKKVVGVAKGSAPSKPGTPGAVGFFITEYIKVYGSMSKISTTYNYAWEE